jgi:hypothetical protein
MRWSNSRGGDIVSPMRLSCAVLLSLLVAQPAFADDDAPPPPHHHSQQWYAGWSLVMLGGASSLVGVGLTTNTEPGGSTAGWVLAGVGTATWIGGAVVLRLNERRMKRRSADEAAR